MQEKFALRKALKGVAALGTGVAMLGMTLSGALAADLGSFPGSYSGATFVVGSGAANSDTTAANMITGLDAFRSVEGGTPGATVLTEGGATAEIPLGKNVVSTVWDGFDEVLDDTDLEVLQDGEVNFQNTDYDYREFLVFGQNNNVSLEISLTSDEEYETVPRLEVETQSMYYIFGFDEAVNVSKATTSNTMKLNFLGKSLEIRYTGDESNIGVDGAREGDQFTSFVGNEFFLKEGDSVTIDGKTLELVSVSSNGVVSVSVDGVLETISEDNTETVNGLEVSNELGFYTSKTGADSYANLFVGSEDAAGTWKDGDQFYGGDGTCPIRGDLWDDPDCWDWFVGNLGASSATTVTNNITGVSVTGPYIGVRNDFAVNDLDENPPTAGGECINFPNNFASVCFDSLTESEDNFMTMTIDVEDSISFVNSEDSSGNDIPGFNNQSRQRAVAIEVNDNEGLELLSTGLGGGITSNQETNRIWISTNDSSDSLGDEQYFDVFFENTNGQVEYGGAIGNSSTSNLFRVDYESTQGNNMVFFIPPNPGGANNFNLSMQVEGKNTNDLATGGDNVTIRFGTTGDDNEIYSIGANVRSADSEPGSITWASAGSTTFTDLTKRDEDVRGLYGWVMRDPESNNDNERVILEIPGEQVYGNIRVTARALQGAGGDSSTPGTVAPTVMTDSQVDSADGRVVAVGGPCVNSVAAMLLGVGDGACGAGSGFEEGVGYVKSVDDDLVVAGWEAEDTTRAATVLKNHADFSSSLSGSNEVRVTGGLDVASIEVSGV